MTIYKEWLDIFKEPIWTMRDFADEIEWESGQVSIFQSGHSEYQVYDINCFCNLINIESNLFYSRYDHE